MTYDPIDSDADGTVEADVGDGTTTADHLSVQTDELQNTKYLFGSNDPSPSKINTALSNHDKVVLKGDHTSLSDRIEAQNSGTELVIGSNATLKIADGASPTLVSFTGSDHAVPIYNDGINDFHIICRGVIDCNDTNLFRPSPVYIDGSTTAITDGSVNFSAGGKFIDSHAGVYLENVDNYHVPRVFTDDCNNAATGCQDSTNVTYGTVVSIDSGEAVDINGSCTGVDVDTVIGDNISEEIVDVNAGSSDITIQSVVSRNQSDTGVRVGGATNVTINSIVGDYASQALLTTQTGAPHLHAHVNATSPQRTVYLRGGNNGDLDGLRLTGYAEMTNASGGDHAFRIDANNANNGTTSEDIRIDIEAASANGKGLTGNGLVDFKIDCLAHDCSSQGLDLRDLCADGIIEYVGRSNNGGTGWTARYRGDNAEIYGNVENELRLGGDNNVAGPNIASVSSGGTGNVQVDTSSI